MFLCNKLKCNDDILYPVSYIETVLLNVQQVVIVVAERKHCTFWTVAENEGSAFEMSVIYCTAIGPFGNPPARALEGFFFFLILGMCRDCL
jgi:hypothetical protein